MLSRSTIGACSLVPSAAGVAPFGQNTLFVPALLTSTHEVMLSDPTRSGDVLGLLLASPLRGFVFSKHDTSAYAVSSLCSSMIFLRSHSVSHPMAHCPPVITGLAVRLNWPSWLSRYSV